MNLSPQLSTAVRLFTFVAMVTSAAMADDTAPAPKMQSAKDLFSDQPKGLSEQIAAWKFIYNGEAFGDVSGGLRQGAIYEGMVKFGVGVNLEKLLGWENAAFYANIIIPHGDSLTNRYTGDFNVVSNIDTYDSLRLYKLWLQKVFDDGKWSVRVGQIAADKECFVSDGASLYFNNAFGTFPVFSANIPGPIFPLSAPGARVKWTPSDEFSLIAMVFSGDVGYANTNVHNTDWQFHGRNGTLSLVEMAYKTNQSDDAKGLPGTFKLGGFYDSKSFGDQFNTTSHQGDWGIYGMADQLLYREPVIQKDDDPRGLGIFVRAGLAPQSNRNVITFDFETGLNYTGLLPSRSKDITGIGFAYTRLSDPYVMANNGTKHHEALIELTHLVVLGDHFSLQPDIQYIMNPGGLGGIRNALAAGLRFTVNY